MNHHITIPTQLDPFRQYRADEILALGYSPYRAKKNIRRWMLRIGGRYESVRVVVVSGQKIMEATR